MEGGLEGECESADALRTSGPHPIPAFQIRDVNVIVGLCSENAVNTASVMES
jgi:hypothetical protein